MFHVESELSRLSRKESESIRLKIVEQKAHLRRAMVNAKGNPTRFVQIRKDISDAFRELDNINLGIEHFFREIGRHYEANQTVRTDVDSVKLPHKVAELFAKGHPIELVNGDTCTISEVWLNAIFKSLIKSHKNLRVFVVSIIGLQSSGKSTLLNSLFACRFAVSVGRCSRGLFMRLLFLEKAIVKEYNVDAILLVDTEGLGSPEKMNDPEAEKKDRLLATFAMGISNLTIINVLGEGIKEITEILQIAVVTMTRLEQAGITPDVMLVQHLLTEKNSEKLTESEEQFCKAVRIAIDLADEKDVHVGVRSSKCLNAIYKRIETGSLLVQFHPYKDGATTNASPSEAYHMDVVNLYDKILECCKSSNTVIEFKKWRSLVLSYWENANQENFALRFKNIKEIYEFIDRGEKIALVKQSIDAAFGVHARRLIVEIVSTKSEAGVPLKYRRDELVKQFKDSISRLPCTSITEQHSEDDVCKDVIDSKTSLYEHVKNQPCEIETHQTIEKYLNRVRESTERKLSQSLDAMIMRQGCCVEFDTILTQNLRTYLSQKGAGEFTSDERQQIIDEVFESLKQSAQSKDIDVPLKYKVVEELKQEYPAMADIIKRFEREQCRFEELFDPEGLWDRTVNMVFRVHGALNERLNLKCVLEDLPTNVLEKRQADSFEDGMVRELCYEINENIGHSKKYKLSPEEKANIHVWVQQLFFGKIQVLQSQWDKKNKAYSILSDNKDSYIQVINARLDCGFNCMSEGKVISLHLTKVIRQKAINAENMARIRAVEGLVWTTNSEKVRLKYLKEIALQLVHGNKEPVLAHIDNPQKKIEKWYTEEVDRYRSSTYRYTFDKTIKAEYDTVLREVFNASGIAEIIRLAQTFSNGIETASYQPTFDFSNADNPQELEVMKSEIRSGIEERKEVLAQFDESDLSKPSENREVIFRMGCTRTCYWCGALCWGQRGHDENTDETRKHHSSHQPRGLAKVHGMHTGRLVPRACHDTPDEQFVLFGIYRDSENGITWKDAKEDHFSDWKFDRHYITKFDELMRWLFQELHHDIARTSGALKPATDTELRTHNCVNLAYNDIIARIEQEID